jgi:hypothetical protein
VHPDKNYGCANAGEAFKCLQSAYETLIDPVKRKDYEDELKGLDMAERLNKMAEDARNHSRGPHRSNSHSTQGVSHCGKVLKFGTWDFHTVALLLLSVCLRLSVGSGCFDMRSVWCPYGLPCNVLEVRAQVAFAYIIPSCLQSHSL